MGQGGNAFEWEETDFDLMNGSGSSSVLGGRGVIWGSGDSNILSSSARGGGDPAVEGNGVGFRVASVPEPSTLLLGVLGAVGLLVWRKVLP